MTEKEKRLADESVLAGKTTPDGQHFDSEAEFNVKLAKELVRRTDKLGKTEVDVAIQMKQAREFLEWSHNHMKSSWLEWLASADKTLNEIRMTRIAINAEHQKLCADVKDIRDLMTAPMTLAAIEQTRALVSCLERLKSLREDGTMEPLLNALLARCTPLQLCSQTP